MQRTAVDASAEDYWEEYFGEYGKQWVRKIPRRIATALLRDKRAARGKVESIDLKNAFVTPVTLAPVITPTHVIVEGILEKAASRRLFAASFTHDGALVALNVLPL